MGMSIANLPETSDVIAKTILWQYDRAPNLQQFLWHQRQNEDGDTVQDGFMQLMLSSTHDVGKSFYRYIFNAVNTAEEESSLTEEEKEKLEFGLSLWTVIAGLQRPVVVNAAGTTRQVSLRAWARYIKGEIFKFYSNGSSESLNEFLDLTLPDTQAHVVDNQDMTQEYVFDSELSGDDADLVNVDDFLPHPGGVVSTTKTEIDSGVFGYNGYYNSSGRVLTTETVTAGYYYTVTSSGKTTYPMPAEPYYDSEHDPLSYDSTGKYYYKLIKTNYGSSTQKFYSQDSDGEYHELALIDGTNYGYTDTTTGQVVQVGKRYFYTDEATGYNALTWVPASESTTGSEYWWYNAKSEAITTLYTLLSDGTTYQELTKIEPPYFYYMDSTGSQKYLDVGTDVYAYVTNSTTGVDELKLLTKDVYTGTYYWTDTAGNKHFVLGQQMRNYEHGYYYQGENPTMSDSQTYIGLQDSPAGETATQSSKLTLIDGAPDTTKANQYGILFESDESK